MILQVRLLSDIDQESERSDADAIDRHQKLKKAMKGRLAGNAEEAPISVPTAQRLRNCIEWPIETGQKCALFHEEVGCPE